MFVNKTNITIIIILTTTIIENSQGTVLSNPVVLNVQSQTSNISVTWNSLEMQMLRLYLRPRESETRGVGPGTV